MVQDEYTTHPFARKRPTYEAEYWAEQTKRYGYDGLRFGNVSGGYADMLGVKFKKRR